MKGQIVPIDYGRAELEKELFGIGLTAQKFRKCVYARRHIGYLGEGPIKSHPVGLSFSFLRLTDIGNP